MTTLANAKHEAVAQAFIADQERVGWRAYRAIYPKSSQHAAESGWARLLKIVEFSARIAELAEAAAEGAEITYPSRPQSRRWRPIWPRSPRASL